MNGCIVFGFKFLQLKFSDAIVTITDIYKSDMHNATLYAVPSSGWWKMAGCVSRNKVVIGPHENGFPCPAVALDRPYSICLKISTVQYRYNMSISSTAVTNYMTCPSDSFIDDTGASSSCMPQLCTQNTTNQHSMFLDVSVKTLLTVRSPPSTQISDFSFNT